MRKLVLPLAGLTLSLVLWSGCDESSQTQPTGPSSVRVMLTDAPSDYIESAEVVISRVYLKAAGADSSETDSTEVDTTEAVLNLAGANDVDLLEEGEDPLVFDLTELRDGIQAFLGERPVEPGMYTQLRLVVDEATVTLIEGYTFPDESSSAELKTPGAHKSGIKVDLAEPIAVEEGKVTIMVVDFDIDQNFKLQGNPETPAGIKGVLFTPVLKEKSRHEEEVSETP